MRSSLYLLAFSDRIESDSRQQLDEKCAGALFYRVPAFFVFLCRGRAGSTPFPKYSVKTVPFSRIPEPALIPVHKVK